MDLQEIDPKLLKVVALAKSGVGGEKQQAIRIVKRICVRDGLDFEAVMNGEDQPKHFEPEFKFKHKDEIQIAIQVASKIATSPEYPKVVGGHFRGVKRGYVEYTTTAAKHIETINAIEIYLAAYRREKDKIAKAMQSAFVIRHQLWTQFKSDSDEDRDPMTPEQREELERALGVAGALSEEVKLHKAIEGGKS